MSVGSAGRQLAIFCVNRSVAWLRNWIIRVAFGARIFANHTRARVLLPSQMFKLSDASEAKVIGIIHDRGGLELFAVEGSVLKLK